MYNKEEKKLLNLYLKGEKKKNLTLCLFIYLQKKHKMIRQQKRMTFQAKEMDILTMLASQPKSTRKIHFQLYKYKNYII